MIKRTVDEWAGVVGVLEQQPESDRLFELMQRIDDAIYGKTFNSFVAIAMSDDDMALLQDAGIDIRKKD